MIENEFNLFLELASKEIEKSVIIRKITKIIRSEVNSGIIDHDMACAKIAVEFARFVIMKQEQIEDLHANSKSCSVCANRSRIAKISKKNRKNLKKRNKRLDFA